MALLEVLKARFEKHPSRRGGKDGESILTRPDRACETQEGRVSLCDGMPKSNFPEALPMKSALPEVPILRATWPHDESLDLSHACARLGLEGQLEILAGDRAGLTALSKAIAPIVGIVGSLNGGKTSTVKKFLSPAGRLRAPSGKWNETGTQRFVFWLPASWKSEPEVWRSLKEELEAVFGPRLEEMSNDPEAAARQYNGDGNVANHLGTPLVAFDEGLERYGFAMMDSPDMERGVPGVQNARTSELRVEFVQRAMRMLSAVLLLCEDDKVDLDVLGRPFEAADGMPVFLLLNQVGCEEGELERHLKGQGLRELQARVSASRTHAAYHGRHEGAAQLIAEIVQTEDFDRGLPHFFRVDPPVPDGDPPVLLEDELARLEPAKLWQDKVAAKRASLEKGLDELGAAIRGRQDGHRSALGKTRDYVIAFVRSQVRDSQTDELATPLTASTSAQIADAIVEHCPFYAKPTMWVHGLSKSVLDWLRRLKQAGKAAASPSDALRDKAAEFAKSLASGGIKSFNSSEWATNSLNQKFMPDGVEERALRELWTEVGNKATDMKVELDPAILASFANSLWDALPIWKKLGLALTGPVLLIAALAALAFACFDGGNSVVLFFSLKELLVTLGLGALAPTATLLTGQKLERNLIDRAAIPFYTRLVKSALDAFGLPRTGLSPVQEHFANTGKFALDLDPEPGEARLTTRIDLSGGYLLGSMDEGGWASCRLALLEVPVQSPTKS